MGGKEVKEGSKGLKVVTVKQDNRWWSRIIQEILVFTMVHYIFWIFIPLGLFYVLYRLGYSILIPVLILLYLPSFLDGSHMKNGRPWKSFRCHPLWDWVQRHCGIQVVRTAELNPSKQYIFGCHPHGILILSRVFVYGGVWEQLFPGIDFRVLGATPMFFVPACREMCLWMNAIDASKESAEKALKSKLSLHIYPGGSKEIFHTTPGSKDVRLVLKDRKGFVKLAIRHGADLVPTVVFGEQEAFHRLHINEGVKKWFLKNLKVPLLVFWGRFFTWTPLRAEMAMVFGAPIPVIQNPSPTDAEVDALHQKYIDELRKLYNEHKVNYHFAKDLNLIIE